ncbi:MAG: DUF47 family protein [Erysipelotrichaceae bacterium]|nr:DUF47 family protein [Erysipelotrichaceae bacterium]
MTNTSKKSFDYFDYFMNVAEIARTQAVILNRFLTDYHPELLESEIKEMHSMEHMADERKAEMMAYLIKDFLPPIDSEDITDLSELLDDVCDNIDDVMMHFYMYNIEEIRPDVDKITQGIIQITTDMKQLCDSLRGLKNLNSLMDLTRKVNDEEEVGDSYYLEAVHQLYCTPNLTSYQINGWENIYHGLENCYDACEDVANTIRNIIIKHS